MAELEIVHVKNGEGNNPLYKIRKVGGDWVSSALLKEHQALEYLEKHVPKEVAVAVVEETTTVPDYKNMSLCGGMALSLTVGKAKKPC